MERNYSLDTLRTIAALFVVMIHAGSPYYMGVDTVTSNYLIAIILDSFVIIATPLFIMMSGAFLLRGDATEPFAQFYRKRASRILTPLIVWSIVAIVVRVLFDGKFSRTLVVNILSGEPFYHLWYLYMVLGLYAITPFLRTLTARLPRHTLWAVALTVLCINCIYAFWGIQLDHMQFGFIINWFNYLGYFLLGYLFVSSNNRFSSAFLIGGYLVSMAIAATGTISFFPGKASAYFLNRNSLLIVFGALCFFQLFNQWKPSKPNFLSRLAPYSFGIYLIHAFVIETSRRFGLIPENAFVGVFFLLASSLSVSFLLTWILKKVNYLRRII